MEIFSGIRPQTKVVFFQASTVSWNLGMENHSQLNAFILCGGKGTRLASRVNDCPKPLASIGNRTFLSYLIDFIKKSKIHDLVFLTGHKGEMIRKSLGENFHYSHEETPLGTGGAIRLALINFPSEFHLIINGDTLFMIDYSYFLREAQKILKTNPDKQIVMALKKWPISDRYLSVNLGSDAAVLSFGEYCLGERLINSGIYLVRNGLTSSIGPGFVSLEDEIFPTLIQQQKVAGIELEGDFLDIGIPSDYERAQTLIPLWMSRV